MLANVLLLSYNRPRMLVEAINSVMNQTHVEKICWLFDDASDFDVDKVVRDNFESSAPINICKAGPVSIDERIRPGSNRWPENINFVLEQMNRGEFVTYLCDDDIADAKWLESCSRALTESPQTHMILGDMYYYYDGQDPVEDSIKGFPAKIELDDKDYLMWWNLGAFSYRTDCYWTCDVKWGEGLHGYAHSWDISLIEAMKAAHPGYIFLPEPAVYRREHDNTLSARMGRINADGLYYKEAEEMLPEHVTGFLE